MERGRNCGAERISLLEVTEVCLSLLYFIFPTPIFFQWTEVPRNANHSVPRGLAAIDSGA